MFITLYFIVTRLPDSLRSVRDHFLSLDPTSLTVDLLKQHLLAAETSAVAVGAARGTPRPPFFEGCSLSPLAPSYASAVAANVPVAEDLGAASASAKHRSSKGKGGRGGGGGNGSGGGGSSGGGGGSGGRGSGGSGGGSGGVGGGGGGTGGSGGSDGNGTGGSRTGARRGGDRAGQTCGRLHTQHCCFNRLDDAWRAEFGDDVEHPRWADLLRSGVAIFDLDFDVILSAIYALSVICGTLPGTAPTEALHTFSLDLGASRSFFRDSTTLTPLPAPVPVRQGDPSEGPVIARSSTLLPCPVVPSGSLSGLHLPSFSTNLVSTAALQDTMVTTTTPGGQRVSICTYTRTGHHLATFTHRPGSILYTLATEPPQVAASAQPSWHALSPPCVLSPQVSASPTALACSALPSLCRGMAVRCSSLLLVSPDNCSSANSPHRLRLQLREWFQHDLPVLRLHSDRGGEFSSGLLRDFCHGEGILQSFMLLASPQKNGIAERCIGLVKEVARTSMIHTAAPHFLWPFAVRYAAHQLNLWPETSPTLRWTGKVGDASVFRFYHPTSRRVLPSHDVTFDESVPFYHLFPYRSAPLPPPLLFLAPGPPPVDPLPPQGPAPSSVSQVDPPSGAMPSEVAIDSGAARGTASGGAEPGGAETGGPELGGAESGGAKPGGAETGGAEPKGAEPGGTEPEGVESGGAESEGAKSGGAEPQGAASSAATGAGGAGAAGAGGAGAAGAGDSGAGDSGAGGNGSGGLAERSEPSSRPVSPVRTARRVPRLRPPPIPGTHAMALCPSSVPLRVPLPAPPDSSLLPVRDPKSDCARATSPTISYYATSLVAEYASASPQSIGGECALGTDVLEDMQEDFQCLAAAVTRFASMLLAPEGDPNAPDIPTPRSYVEAITGPYSSQWQAAMDAKMASWKSTGTYVDEVTPPGANIVDGMWIFRVKRPPGSTPAFKARYVARGFSQRQGVDYFQTFSPAPKMTTLWVLLHIAALRDYELHSLDFSTAFLQGSLHETTLAALGFAPSTADPSLFLRTDTSLPPFYVFVYIDNLVFATADTEALTLEKSELQKRHTCTNLGELRSYLGLQITRDIARRTITLAHSHMVHQVLQRFGFQFSLPQPTPLSTSHSLPAPPLDESVELSGPYPEPVGCLMVMRYFYSTSGMGLVLGGWGPVVLTGQADASWVDDSATQRSSQGYTFSLGSGSVSWRSTHSSLVLGSSCEAEIYAGAMAAQELRWLTYLLTDLGEQPRSPPVLYVDNKAMIALCQEHRLEHRTKRIALRYILA
ncbi:unnamed protein product [Closterium sp. NIES-54]